MGCYNDKCICIHLYVTAFSLDVNFVSLHFILHFCCRIFVLSEFPLFLSTTLTVTFSPESHQCLPYLATLCVFHWQKMIQTPMSSNVIQYICFVNANCDSEVSPPLQFLVVYLLQKQRKKKVSWAYKWCVLSQHQRI